MMSRNQNQHIFSHRYEILQDLGEGGIGKVYKTYDQWMGKDIALKALFTGRDNPSIVESFKREFLLLSELKHPGVVEVLDFGYAESPARAGAQPPTEHGVPYFTMEFVEGKNLQETFAHLTGPGKAPDEFEKLYHLIWQICDILEFLHLRGMAHCDLKPDNLKITDRIFRPKILDFGLSEKIGSKRGKETKGTLPYMAPEMFREETLDERADLYSLGIILYELVTSKLPFFFEDPVKIISAHLEQKPQPPSELNPHLPPFLNELIVKLLEKSPADRPGDATLVKRMVEAGFKQDFKEIGKVNLSPEKTHLAYLRSGPLVEREIELAQLDEYLKQATSSRGDCLYLSGEQGVGKTFLLKSLKMKCQLEGIIFVDSNCLENQTSAYQPLIEILRKLEPYVKNRSPVQLAGNLRDVFRRSAENSSASLETQTLLHQRICQILVEISHPLPLVITIENLQWADLPTLKFLEHFQQQQDKGRIFLICTVREEKLNDNLRLQALINLDSTEENARYLKLKRFDAPRTKSLILSKFTRQRFPEEFFTYIHEKTSGNPFFILEVLKYLLENNIIFLKDSIWMVDAERLEESAVPDSIETILLKNLERYDEKTLNFLNVLAVIGKRFSRRLLKELCLFDEKMLSDILSFLTNDQLLIKKEEFAGERRYYEFANQSLQILLYQRWDKDKRILWHKKVGELQEKLSSSEDEESIFEIAYHYLQAEELDKAYQYALLSAEKMEQRFANPEVLKYLETAIKVASKFSDKQKATEKQVVAWMKRADFCKKVGELNQAEKDYKAILKLIPGSSDLRPLAKTYNNLAETYRLKHDYKKGISCAEKALEILQKLDDPLELANTLSYMGLLYWTNSQYKEAFDAFHKALEIDRRLGNKSAVASTLNNMGLVYWSLHQYSQALKYFSECLSVYRELDNKEWKARTLNNVGATYFHLGDYKQAINYYLESLELNERIKNNKETTFNLENLGDAYRKIGDYNKALNCCQRGLELALEIDYTERTERIFEELGVTYFELGRYQEAYEHFDQANILAEKLQDKELQVSVLINLSKFFTLLNVDQKAMRLLEEATEVIDTINDEKSFISVYEIRSWLKKKERKFEEASKLLDEASALAEKMNAGEEICSLSLDYAELYMDRGDIVNSKRCLDRASNSSLEQYVLLHPAFYLISGRIEWISGNLNSAQNCFETAIGLAKKLNNLEMMWRIHHQLGRLFLSCHDIERAYQELESAGRILKRLSENIKDEELKQSYLKDQEKKELLFDLNLVAKELIGETKMM